MNKQSNIQTRVQHFMVANGMLYAAAQIGILIFVAICLLPLLGPPSAPGLQAYEAYANHTELFRLGNYLMVLPPLFFYLFLGGVYAYFHKLPEGVRGILFTALLSGAVLIMIWPFGAVLSLVGVEIANQGGDAITAASFDSIVPASLALSTIPRTVFLLCLSVLLLDHKWLSRIGFAIAALSMSGSLLIVYGVPFLPMSLGSALLFHVWIFCCSFKMYRGWGQGQENPSQLQVASR